MYLNNLYRIKKDENIKILINNIKILHNNITENKSENVRSMIIYDYLENLNIEYDNEYLLYKMKIYNFSLYKKYFIKEYLKYNNLHNNSRISLFDDYDGNNIWNENTYLYNEIHYMLEKFNYNCKERSPNNLHQTRFK